MGAHRQKGHPHALITETYFWKKMVLKATNLMASVDGTDTSETANEKWKEKREIRVENGKTGEPDRRNGQKVIGQWE
jgi:hypothetical protein